MAATKLQFKYGQWSKEQAIEMSKVAGVVVYSGKTKGIYVDGKEFVSGESSDFEFQNIITMLGAVKNEETGLYVLSNLTNLPTGVEAEVTDVLNSLTQFRADMHVDEYAQATIVPEKVEGQPVSKDSSKLTIFGIGQGVEGANNDGKIFHTENGAKDLVVNIAGAYDSETNRIATEETVNYKVRELRAEIFGTLTPEQLDKTIDSIKEIQEVLKGGDFVEWTHEVVNPETGESYTEVDNVRVLPKVDEDGNPTGEYVLAQVDENGNPVKDENGNYIPTDTVVATVTTDEEGKEVITYAYGYDNLQHTQNVQELLDDINNIENEALVTEINVAENREEKFVTTDTEENTDENGLKTTTYTIGVKYGTFKTGHEEVHNEESKAYVNGIATIEDVQKYIEERFTWVAFESSVEEGIELTSGSTITNEPADANVVITLPEDGTMKVENPIGTDKPIVVR